MHHEPSTSRHSRRPSGLGFDFSGLGHRIALRWQRYRSERELMSLSSSTMKDVGYPAAGGSDVHANPRRKEV